MEVYTCDRPFCLDDGIVQMKELRFRWHGKVTFLKNGRMKDLCLRHAEEVTKDNIFISNVQSDLITELRKKTELRK
jgi:hypothetical protein